MFAHTLSPSPVHGSDVDVGLGRAVRVAATRTREVFCGMRGHDYLLHAAGDRIFLWCPACGHETPGWSLAATVTSCDE